MYGWRFTWYQEDLEYRLNNMQPAEEILITGQSFGSFRLYPRASVGDVIAYTLSDGTNNLSASYTVQASDFALPANTVNPAEASPLYAIALNSANALNVVLSPKGYTAVGVMPADLFSPQYLPPYFAEIDITGPGSNAFTLSATVTGTTLVTVGSQGTASPVAASVTNPVTGLPSTYYGYVALLDSLAMGMTRADLSLWLKQADVAVMRQDEISARRGQYQEYIFQLEMCLGSRDYVQKFGLFGGALGGAGGGATA